MWIYFNVLLLGAVQILCYNAFWGYFYPLLLSNTIWPVSFVREKIEMPSKCIRPPFHWLVLHNMWMAPYGWSVVVMVDRSVWLSLCRCVWYEDCTRMSGIATTNTDKNREKIICLFLQIFLWFLSVNLCWQRIAVLIC